MVFAPIPVGIAITPLEIMRHMDGNLRHPASIGGSLRYLTNRGLLESIREKSHRGRSAYALTPAGGAVIATPGQE
jgi:DNA-binding PadR family transcriptional regulator